MTNLALRPRAAVPAALVGTVRGLIPALSPEQVWVVGPVTGPRTSWEVVVVIPDDAPEAHDDPVTAWGLRRPAEAEATILTMRRSELDASTGLVNTMGRRVATEGTLVWERRAS